MLPYDGYVRVSRIAGRSGDTFIAPAVQRQQIQASAAAFGIEIGETFEDLDVSGGGLDRPGLNEAMERIRLGISGGIIVSHLDRLSRAGVGDALRLVEEIHEHGAKLAANDLGVDPTTPMGEMLMTLMLALGRMERRRIGDSWRVAQSRAIERGVYIASRKPTGYDADKSGRLVPNRYADSIREVFKLRAGGASWVECAAYLNEQGTIGPWGKSNWQGDAVAGVIKSRAYLGESHFGSLSNKTAHEPIIDSATWRLAQRAPLASVPRSSEGLLLSGMIRCSGCMYLMKPGHVSLRGRRRVMYKCGRDYAAGKCPKPASILGDVVEPHTVTWFRDLVGSPEFAQVISTDAREAAESNLADAYEELATFTQNESIRAMGEELFSEAVEVRAEQVRALEEELAELTPHTGTIDMTALFDEGSITDKRDLLHSLIGAVFVRNLGKRAPVDQRVRIVRHGDMPEVPRRGKRLPIASFPYD